MGQELHPQDPPSEPPERLCVFSPQREAEHLGDRGKGSQVTHREVTSDPASQRENSERKEHSCYLLLTISCWSGRVRQRILLRAVHTTSHLTLTPPSCPGHYYYRYFLFTGEETEASRGFFAQSHTARSGRGELGLSSAPFCLPVHLFYIQFMVQLSF